MKWCCENIERSFEGRFEKGISIYAEPPKPKYDFGVTFWLIMRSIDFIDLELYLKSQSECKSKPLKVIGQALVSWTPVHFCPWCGKKLSKYYKKTYTQLTDEKLSDEHQFGI